METTSRTKGSKNRWHGKGIGIWLAGISICMLGPIPGIAQEKSGKQLTLAECLALGQQNQPALKAAQSSFTSAHQGLASLPKGTFSKEIRIRRGQAGIGVEIAQAGVCQAEQETRYAIIRNYYSVLYARLQEKLLKDVVGELEESRDLAQELVKKDPTTKLTKLDVDILMINLANFKAKLLEPQIGSEKAMAALREAMGVDRKFAFHIGEDSLPALVPKLDVDSLIDHALESRAELKIARGAKTITELEVSAQAVKKLKKKVMTFAAGSDVHARPIPQGEANGEYRPGAIGLEVPGMLFGKRSDRISRAGQILERTGAVVDKTENLIVLDVEIMYLKWKEAAEKIKILEDSLKLSKDVAEKTRDRFNKAVGTTDELVRAQTLMHQNQANYNEALYIHALALAGLERASAGGFKLEIPQKLAGK